MTVVCTLYGIMVSLYILYIVQFARRKLYVESESLAQFDSF